MTPTLRTRVSADHAGLSPPLVPLRVLCSSPPEPSSRLPSLRDQSPLPSRPTNSPSRLTTLVSSPTDAETTSTTVSSPSDTVPRTDLSTSSSRTLGVPHGELLDTSRSPQTSAVSPTRPPTQPSERNEVQHAFTL